MTPDEAAAALGPDKYQAWLAAYRAELQLGMYRDVLASVSALAAQAELRYNAAGLTTEEYLALELPECEKVCKEGEELLIRAGGMTPAAWNRLPYCSKRQSDVLLAGAKALGIATKWRGWSGDGIPGRRLPDRHIPGGPAQAKNQSPRSRGRKAERHMSEISFEDLTAGLRGWVRGNGAHEQAAVELLVWHETWLRRPDFKGACITQRAPGLVAIINWYEAREFIDRGYAQRGQRPLPASSSERRVLDLAVALGEDQFGLTGLGRAHKRAAAQAFAAACGLRLEPPVQEVGHNHPDFIPGDPATCTACALAAEG